MIISVKKWNEAAELLKAAAIRLDEKRELTPIQLVAAFRRGLKTVEEIKHKN